MLMDACIGKGGRGGQQKIALFCPKMKPFAGPCVQPKEENLGWEEKKLLHLQPQVGVLNKHGAAKQ